MHMLMGAAFFVTVAACVTFSFIVVVLASCIPTRGSNPTTDIADTSEALRLTP